ncbi:hypothetical protein D3C81_376500 [compost metagenome]
MGFYHTVSQERSVSQSFLEKMLQERRLHKRAILEGRAVPNYTRPKINLAVIGSIPGYRAPRYQTPPNWPFMEEVMQRMVIDPHTQRRLLVMQLRADPDNDLNQLVL